jgi:NADH-quinone oxidoreductase subunit M
MMDFVASNFLPIILFFPVLIAAIILFLPKDSVRLIRWTAFLGSLVPFGLTLWMWAMYQPDVSGFQFQFQTAWFASVHSSFHLGIDGISLTMVLLTTLLTPLALLASFSIKDRVKPYMILFMLLETGMLGVFVSLDLLLFFVFWEVGLVPMYFLINQWGGANRNYASLKFILYTMAGSLGLLLSIQLIGVVTGTFDLPTVMSVWTNLKGTMLGMPVETVKAIAFWAFVIAFAIKVPVWPFHTWLPDAHTEAPTPGSMLLAGVLLKLGAYGFIRLVLPLYPVESKTYAGALAFLAVMAIIFGAFGAYGQDDFKRLVAYSSINHMGFVMLGIAVAAQALGTENAHIAMDGAVLQMFNHGISSAGMFFLVGVIYERTHTRDLNKFGGLFQLMPVYGGLLILTSMASLGLPGLNGFVSEFMVVRGSWPVFTLATALGMIGLLFTGAYILKGIKKVLHGPLNTAWVGHITDISPREIAVMVPLAALFVVLGVWPSFLVDVINRVVVMLF